MKHFVSRRTLLQSAAAAVATVSLPRIGRTAAANEQVHIGCVGVGGKGWSDMQETSVGHHIVAICDVDEERLAKAGEAFPKAKRYTDWRKMLEHPGLHAVTVSTPDHMHAPVTMSAIHAGLHTYTQKPLTHSVAEARALTLAAENQGVVTQMGIQHHSNTFFKTAVRLIRDGVIGTIQEAHVWTDRPVGFWTQGFDRPLGNSEVPSSLHWDLWLGAAPERPYLSDTYHPFKWRAFWDFGTGALGDMGCHGMDPVVHALKLGPPSTLVAEGPRPNHETGPEWSVVRYVFPGTELTDDAFEMTWYDGAKLPARELFALPPEEKLLDNGILFIGSKGQLLVDYFNPPKLLPPGEFTAPIEPEPIDNHYTQWTDAIIGKGQTSCPFAYSGPLTETVLLGNVAARTGRKLTWDSASLTCVGDDEATALIRCDYRPGWEVPGLG